MTSSRSSAAQTPDGRRLLADRDVQEPGQLARAEPLLDLLLEAADQEHLAEEAAKHLFRHAPASGTGLLLYGRHRAAIMLIAVRSGSAHRVLRIRADTPCPMQVSGGTGIAAARLVLLVVGLVLLAVASALGIQARRRRALPVPGNAIAEASAAGVVARHLRR